MSERKRDEAGWQLPVSGDLNFCDLLEARLYNQRTLILNGEIEECGAGLLTNQFQTLAECEDEITLLITSFGGAVEAGGAIIRAIRYAQERGCKVTGEVRGYAMSMAVLVLQACVDAQARVLTADLRWVQGGDVKPGDRLLAFDEHGGVGGTRRWRTTTVQAAHVKPKATMRTELEDGTVVYSTPDHRWLAGANTKQPWRRTDRMNTAGRTTRVRKLLTPWNTPTNGQSAAYLGGFFDGEGTLQRSCLPVASNNDPEVLGNILRLAAELGFDMSLRANGSSVNPKWGQGYVFWPTGGLSEYLRLLGQTRPLRLINRVQDFIGSMEARAVDKLAVVSNEPAAVRDVAVISTDAKTLVVEGFGMHNCDFRFAAPEDIVMVHGFTGSSVGDFRNTEANAEMTKQLTGIYAKLYADRSTAEDTRYHSEEYWSKLLKDSLPHYMFGHEALEKGLIDAVLV